MPIALITSSRTALVLAAARERAAELGQLLGGERHAMAAFLVALADFDRRRLWEELGHASLFAFLRRELKLSAGAAYYRKIAADLVTGYPDVEAALREGKLCLSSVAELAKVLTPENVTDVLPRFHGLSTREAAMVATELRPVQNAPVRDVITWERAPAPGDSTPQEMQPLFAASGQASCESSAPREARPETASPAAQSETAATFPGLAQSAGRARAAAPGAGAAIAPPRRATVDPLDRERARVHLTVSRRFLAKLETARNELSHAIPGATLEQVLERAVDELLAAREKRRRPPEKPRPARPSKPGRVTAAVRREVWARAGGACEYPLADGTRCGSTLRLEIDHVEPRALGGGSSAEELRVACAAHNQIAGRRKLGAACMATRRRGSPRAGRIDEHGGGESRALRGGAPLAPPAPTRSSTGPPPAARPPAAGTFRAPETAPVSDAILLEPPGDPLARRAGPSCAPHRPNAEASR